MTTAKREALFASLKDAARRAPLRIVAAPAYVWRELNERKKTAQKQPLDLRVGRRK